MVRPLGSTAPITKPTPSLPHRTTKTNRKYKLPSFLCAYTISSGEKLTYFSQRVIGVWKIMWRAWALSLRDIFPSGICNWLKEQISCQIVIGYSTQAVSSFNAVSGRGLSVLGTISRCNSGKWAPFPMMMMMMGVCASGQACVALNLDDKMH